MTDVRAINRDFEKYDQVLVPDFLYSAMENALRERVT